MIRGSTPTLEFNLPFEVSGVAKLYVTFAQNGRVLLEKGLDDCEADGSTLRLTLSQAETLAFSSGRQVEIQIRVKFTDGTATASDPITDSVDHIYKDGEI